MEMAWEHDIVGIRFRGRYDIGVPLLLSVASTQRGFQAVGGLDRCQFIVPSDVVNSSKKVIDRLIIWSIRECSITSIKVMAYLH